MSIRGDFDLGPRHEKKTKEKAVLRMVMIIMRRVNEEMKNKRAEADGSSVSVL